MNSLEYELLVFLKIMGYVTITGLALTAFGVSFVLINRILKQSRRKK